MDLGHIHNKPLDSEKAAIIADARYHVADFCYKQRDIVNAYRLIISAIGLYKGILNGDYGQQPKDTKREEIEIRLEYARAFMDDLDDHVEIELSRTRKDRTPLACRNADTMCIDDYLLQLN
ncbi:MAG: hypothetical protein QF824_02530 [Candidatus Woesearchaeota archaeon]|jgi:hypothetical protein|nr:hypothetical protein [Candidatus Woesearchaeota archaeon]|tara:strand:- start:384 stop:746 length:363 start_codon:yes stop_codon:yes gene_type:complete